MTKSTSPSPALRSPLDKAEGSVDLLSSIERAAQVSRSLHDLLVAAERMDLARLAWVVHLETSGSAERVGEALGVEVQIA